MSARIAINGFGRIGRSSFKIALEKQGLEISAVNDLTNPRVLAHLLKYDSAYGIYDKDIYLEEDGKKVSLEDNKGEKDFFSKKGRENYLVVNGKKTLVLAEKDPTLLPWKELDIDVVLECTGRFTQENSADVHIKRGAKKVVVSAPTKGGNVPIFLLGVNEDQYLGQNIISNASCTTNCISPVIDIVNKKFRVLKSVMTTVHALTNNQSVVDSAPFGEDLDMRRSRASGYNMSPTTTGAAKATTKVIPELEGLFDGISVRVPIITGSLSDITMLVGKKTTAEDVNKAFLEAKKLEKYKNILDATYEPITSSDIIGSIYSSIVDLSMTRVVDGDLVKILAWYDNEWGYSNRLVEMAMMVS
ncbi:MAG TPA: glyceraldehyde 3-phosphate dehydrogenase NAD-binding domain-containing protein [bacterium]|nr:glyceraldehyde 3-phosphate dehydrogenase NAD-binding domain-containing protein [bacterium]